MDRAFLSYYEDELVHVRSLAAEFAALHPAVARNLSLDAVPCPDPYVERLLEGVAFLAARTRLKVDAESGRYVRNLLDALYPDLVGPAPAMTLAELVPGPQVDTMLEGHVLPRGTRLVAGLREGLSTRATYTTAQEVTLWPLRVDAATYLPDTGALRAAGLSDGQVSGAEAGLRITLARRGPGMLSELRLDRLDLFLGGRSQGGTLFDAVFGWGRRSYARPARNGAAWRPADAPAFIGIADGEGLLPRVRDSFEGYRLLREYFLMPDRFHFVRLAGFAPTVSQCGEDALEIVVALDRPVAAASDLSAADLVLHATPVVNLFERECNMVELDGRRPAHIVYPDRARPRDFEVYRLLRVEDADNDGPAARLAPVYGTENRGEPGHLYATERRPRRPGEDELRRGQTRTSYAGDNLYISVSSRGGRDLPSLRRLDVRALCTNRDLPILDDTPTLTPEGGDPIAAVRLVTPMRRPRESLAAQMPRGAGAEDRADALAWRLVAQLSLDHLSLADGPRDAEPLRAMLALYADRGDPAVARHAASLRQVASRPVVERLDLPGPLCFGHGAEITLDVDESVVPGDSALLLSALLSRLFARYAAVNAFTRTRTHLIHQQEDVAWPMTPGKRPPI